MDRKVEILAPAGSFESMKAAVAAGADAVYIGGNRFGARAYAENLDEEGMLLAIDYVHLHGRRIYMTVNTLVKDQELAGLYEYLSPYYQRGLDAVIVQDMGVFRFLRENFPLLPIHASTQMTITGPRGARLLSEMGAARIVTARELSLEEIQAIYRETGVEIESFVHGALCFCYSGQCLMSSLIGGRSGNRGRCAQTCRLPFEVKRGGETLNKKEERYVLSLKDLCTLDLLPDLIDAGIYSMKIEGRMKSPRYTAGVVRIYRKYVDLYLKQGRRGYRVVEEDRRELLDLFDRGGQTDGYYKRRGGREMTVLKEKPAFRQENRELFEYLDRTFVEAVLREPAFGKISVKEGEALALTFTAKGKTVHVSGPAPESAKNQPVSEEKVRKQLEKTGNTPFYLKALEVQIEGRPFLTVQQLNELRREGLERLEEAILNPHRRELKKERPWEPAEAVGDSDYRREGLHVSLERPETLDAVLSEDGVSQIYIDSTQFEPSSWKQTAERCQRAGRRCFLSLPHIYRQEAERFFRNNQETFLAAGFDGVVMRAWEEIDLLREWRAPLKWVMDYGLYTMNQKAEREICEMAGGREEICFTLPLELNSRELEKRGCHGRELIVYGYLPAMVTAQCIRKIMRSCDKQSELLYLKDRIGKQFPVKNQCRFCYNTIYNSSPLSLLSEKDVILRLNPGSLRLNFTIENEAEIRRIIRAFCDGFILEKEAALSGEFTRGHFRRGVE